MDLDPDTTLYAPDGRSVVVRSAKEQTNLRASGYRDTPPEAITVPAENSLAGAQEFDPSQHTVDEVKAFLADHPESADAVLAAEAAGKNRSSITGA